MINTRDKIKSSIVTLFHQLNTTATNGTLMGDNPGIADIDAEYVADKTNQFMHVCKFSQQMAQLDQVNIKAPVKQDLAKWFNNMTIEKLWAKDWNEVCPQLWSRAIEEQKKANEQIPLNSFAMNLAYSQLDQNISHPGLNENDTLAFLIKHDLNKDKGLNKTELMSVVDRTLFGLVFEYALYNGDPRKVYSSSSSDNVVESAVSKHFPEPNSTIGDTQLKTLLSQLDTNSDKNVTRAELYSLFLQEKDKVAQPFLVQLRQSFQKLDQLTSHPIEFSLNAKLYYISGADQVKNYNDSKKFCGQWGGKPLNTTKVVSHIGNVSRAYWFESGDNLTFCKDFSLTLVNSNKSCSDLRQFICEKDDAVELVIMAQKRQTVALAIVIPIVILLIVFGIICACKFWHKEANTINIKKLPQETPVGSPRSGVHQADHADEKKKEKVALVKSNANDVTEQD